MEKPFRKIHGHKDAISRRYVINYSCNQYTQAELSRRKNRYAALPDTIPILSENPEINALYGISNKGAGTFDKIKNALSLIKTLRANNYDLVINLTDQWMVALLVRCLPARMKISQFYGHRQHGIWKKLYTLSTYTRYTYC